MTFNFTRIKDTEDIILSLKSSDFHINVMYCNMQITMLALSVERGMSLTVSEFSSVLLGLI